jgi:hypothetical protein
MAETIIAPTDLSDEQIDMILDAAKVPEPPESMLDYDVKVARAILAHVREEPEDMARKFHEAYERLAPVYGYETRHDTRAFDPASPNGRLMIAVCSELLGVAPLPPSPESKP